MEEVKMERPMTFEEAQKRVAEVAKYPRITKESIEAKIDHVEYIRSGSTTLALITLMNGFQVVGLTAPADPRNYDKAVGEAYAYDNAFRQLWQLEGYLLKTKLHEGVITSGPT
jgi:hypothetical protein